MQTEYNPLEAAVVAHAHLPVELRGHLNLEDVLYILYQEFRYHEVAEATITPLATFNQSQVELIVTYINGVALQEGRSYSTEQIAYVLKGEDMYLRQIGLLSP